MVPMDYASPEQMRAWATGIMDHNPPDFVIGPAENPYMERWWIIPRNEACNVYLHRILRSDDDRALHDHPWANTSYLIDGEYDEILPLKHGSGYEMDALDYQPDNCVTRRRKAGDVVQRQATDAHRLVLPEGGKPVISLFMTGPKVREWGFWCAKGWVPWQEFTGGAHGEIVGRGCD
jgi:hypothetical protein